MKVYTLLSCFQPNVEKNTTANLYNILICYIDYRVVYDYDNILTILSIETNVVIH